MAGRTHVGRCPWAEVTRWAWLRRQPFNLSLSYTAPIEPFDTFRRLLPPIGPAILLAWGLLLASGRWRAETSWVDRLGRFLGTLWVLALPLAWWLEAIG